ncbi:MAG: hypothetical protein AB1486_01380 [Planctomycetota bacterium]
MRSLVPMMLLIVLGLASACSTYDTRYRYRPKPLDALVVTGGEPSRAIARALISVTGVRKDSDEEPAGVEVSLLIDNIGEHPLSLDLAATQLVAGDLSSLDPPRVTGGADGEVAAGQSLRLQLFFPFPAGAKADDLDLDGLSLRWTLRIGSETFSQTSTFQRLYRYYDDFYYPPPYWWGPPYSGWYFGGYYGVHRH